LRTHLLQGRLGLGCVADHGGDGITYLAFDEQGRRTVYVREFFPAAIALREQGYLTQTVMQGCNAVWRDCAQNFMELWHKLQRLRGLSALPAVTDVFEENGTIYAVYDYIESMTLRDFLLRGKLGYISWERARALLMPVLSTLGNLHQQGIIHRGISPGALFFGADGKVRIGGFSIWQARTAHGDLTADLADGYAALEQYGLEEQQGAWTDIYAFASVLYRCLVGSDPDDAVTRRHNDRVMVPAPLAENIPAYVINALINAMQVFPDERTRTVEQLRAELSASPAAVAQSAKLSENTTSKFRIPPPVGSSAKPEKRTARRRRASGGAVAVKAAMLCIAAGLVLCAAAVGIWFRDDAIDAYHRLAARPEATAAPIRTTAGERFVVPLFEGKEYSGALKAQYEGKLAITVNERSDDFAEAGKILKQSIQDGTPVEYGTPITLTVSTGKPGIELPDAVGKDIKEVTGALEALGFEVVTTEIRNDGGHKAGAVAAMEPSPGQSYPQNTKVYIKVWGGVNGETETIAEGTQAE
jgi:serine/threonine-protein kinase